MYKFYNANARGRFTNDCVIRAISLAEDKTWNETYRELSRIAPVSYTHLTLPTKA